MFSHHNYINNFENPAFFLIISGIMLYFLGKKLLPLASILFCVNSAFILRNSSFNQEVSKFKLFSMELTDLAINNVNLFFSYMFITILLLLILFYIGTKSVHSKTILGLFIHVGGAIEAILTGDYLTMFFAIEVMWLGSMIIILSRYIIHYKVILRYIIMHAISSSLILFGIIFISYESGSYEIQSLSHIISEVSIFSRESIAKFMILLGMVINIGCPPFTKMITEIYSEIHPDDALAISVFSTKVTLLLLIRLFSGTQMLLYVGILMIIYGLIYSIFTIKIRKIMVYNIICQFGLICALISNSNEVNAEASYLMIVNHILYNLIIFMMISIVIKKLNTENIEDLRGAGKIFPKLFLCTFISSLSIIGLPFTFGYEAKSLLMQSMHDEEIILLLLSFVNVILIINFYFRILAKTFFKSHKEHKNLDISYFVFGLIFVISLVSLFGIARNLLPFELEKLEIDINDIFKYIIYIITALILYYIMFVYAKIDRYILPDILDIYKIFKFKMPNLLEIYHRRKYSLLPLAKQVTINDSLLLFFFLMLILVFIVTM